MARSLRLRLLQQWAKSYRKRRKYLGSAIMTTFIGALRQDGRVAPCAFDGPPNPERNIPAVRLAT